MKTQTQLQVPSQSFSQRGAARCAVWATRPQDTREVLCFGTGLGYLVVWTQSVRKVGRFDVIDSRMLTQMLGRNRRFRRGECTEIGDWKGDNIIGMWRIRRRYPVNPRNGG